MGPHLGVPGAGGDGLAARLDRWAADARIDEAAQRRTRERWLRQQAAEGGRFVGVLADVAERGLAVNVHVPGGRRHSGVVRAVGHDFLMLRSGPAEVLVALKAVRSVRVRPGEAVTVGDRSIATPLRLADALGGLAGERARVLVITGDGGDIVAGTLQSVGHDVVVVRTEGDPPAPVYLPLGAVTEVVLGG